MWPCSRKAERGRVTAAPAKFASPGLGLTTARSAGNSPRLVPPFSLIDSFGLKPSLAQLVAWKASEGLASCPLLALRLALTSFGPQPVGFKVKLGLSMSTWIVR